MAGFYRAESDKAYVIRKVGTDSATKAQVKPAGGGLAEVIADAAPMHSTEDNILGPLELGDFYLVVPPDKTLEFSGADASQFRLIGEILELAPGEVMPTSLLARYGEQAKKYMSYLTGSYDHGTDKAWPADEEHNVLVFPCPAGERWGFDGLYMARGRLNVAIWGVGDFASRIYVQDVPWDILETQVGAATYKMGRKGIDHRATPYPPEDGRNIQPFSLASMPIAIEPGRILKVTATNTSGAELSAAGSGWHYTFDVLVVGKKELLS